MKKFLFLFIVFLIITNISFGEEEYLLQGIIFKGVKYTPYSQIQELLRLKPFQRASLSEIESEIRRIKDLKIFQDITYSLNKIDNGYELVIYIKEFPVILEIDFPKLRLFKEEDIKSKIYSKVGNFYIEEKIREDLKIIKDLYESKGYLLNKEPSYTFENNKLTFIWEELPPIKDIIFQANSKEERTILEKEVDFRLKEDFNKNKIDSINQRLLRKNIPFRVEYKYEVEEDGIILYLFLRPLSFNFLYLSYSSPYTFNLGYSNYNIKLGSFLLETTFSQESSPFYLFSWIFQDFSFLLKENFITLAYMTSFRKDLDIKLGIKFPIFSQGNKSLVFSLERNTLIQRESLYIGGGLQKLNIDFVGGGSPENYTAIEFFTDNYWGYGKELEERILQAHGRLRYIIGSSSEKSNLSLMVSYGFPISKGNYIFLRLGGDSNLSEEFIIFNLFGQIDYSIFAYPWNLNLSLIFRGPEKLEWKIGSKLNF